MKISKRIKEKKNMKRNILIIIIVISIVLIISFVSIFFIALNKKISNWNEPKETEIVETTIPDPTGIGGNTKKLLTREDIEKKYFSMFYENEEVFNLIALIFYDNEEESIYIFYDNESDELTFSPKDVIKSIDKEENIIKIKSLLSNLSLTRIIKEKASVLIMKDDIYNGFVFIYSINLGFSNLYDFVINENWAFEFLMKE